MRKGIYISLVLLLTFLGGIGSIPAKAAAADRSSTVAVILLGSLEFQQRDYYEIVSESLQQKFPKSNFKLFVGDYPQHMFNRYSDKQGLLPGEIPAEDKLADFAWTHSFDRVLFLLFTAPSVKSSEITIQWENAEVTVTARALTFDSRQKKKLLDLSTSQTFKALGRNSAKKAVFKKCLEALQSQMNTP